MRPITSSFRYDLPITVKIVILKFRLAYHKQHPVGL